MTVPSPAERVVLRRLAEAATPGPWRTKRVNTSDAWNPYRSDAQLVVAVENVARCDTEATSAFIAACDPPTVLGLLATIDTLTAENERLREKNRLLIERDTTQAIRASNAEIELDEARSALTAVEARAERAEKDRDATAANLAAVRQMVNRLRSRLLGPDEGLASELFRVLLIAPDAATDALKAKTSQLRTERDAAVQAVERIKECAVGFAALPYSNWTGRMVSDTLLAAVAQKSGGGAEPQVDVNAVATVFDEAQVGTPVAALSPPTTRGRCAMRYVSKPCDPETFEKRWEPAR